MSVSVCKRVCVCVCFMRIARFRRPVEWTVGCVELGANLLSLSCTHTHTHTHTHRSISVIVPFDPFLWELVGVFLCSHANMHMLLYVNIPEYLPVMSVHAYI